MLTRQRKTALLLSWMLAARKRQSPSKHAFSSRRRFVRTRVAAHRQFTPATFDKLDSKLTEWEFKRTFRLSRTVFNEVHGRIEHRLQCNETQRKNASGGTVVDTRIKLMIALRYLAGGSYLDLRLLFEVPTPSLYRIVRKVVDAVNDEYFNEDLVFPTSNVALLAQIQAGFDAMTGNVMTGCVGAIDGIVIRIQGPSFAESDGNPRQYYNRKGFFGLVCLAVCDSREKFTPRSHRGGVHDPAQPLCGPPRPSPDLVRAQAPACTDRDSRGPDRCRAARRAAGAPLRPRQEPQARSVHAPALPRRRWAQAHGPPCAFQEQPRCSPLRLRLGHGLGLGIMAASSCA